MIALFILVSTVNAQNIFDQREQNLVGGLRDRALFDLAESHCQKTLQREGLTPTDHASIAIERIRIKTAAARTATDRNVYWQAVEQVAKEFSAAHPKNPKSVLVGFQQALAHLSFASLLQQELEAKIGDQATRKQGLQQLALSRAILDRTRQLAIDTVKVQANQTLTADMLNNDQLRSLKTNIEYQQAIVNLTSAQLTDASTESGELDRIDSLGRVPRQLESVRRAVVQSRPLWWQTWIREAACRRMLGELESAEKILRSLENTRRPKSVSSMFLQEKIELAIARGDKKRMQQLADVATKQRYDAQTEIALIRLQVSAGQIENASKLAGRVADSHGPWWARRADIALLSVGANVDLKGSSPKAVGSAGARMLLEAAEKAEKNGDLEAAEKGYRSVAESLFSSGDRSAGLATIVRAATALENQDKHQQAADVLIKHGKAYSGESIAASIHLRGCWNLSQAKSSEFVKETKAHIQRWPENESANQARYWLASNQLGQSKFSQALKTLANTQASSPGFPAAIKLARYVCRKQLSELEAKGRVTRPIARQTIPQWEQIYASCDPQTKPRVAVAMAELGLGWGAENDAASRQRLESLIKLPAAQSSLEFHYLLAMLSDSDQARQLVEKAKELPLDSAIVVRVLRLLDRRGGSKRVGELKIAIAENSLAKNEDAKLENLLLLAKAKGLIDLGQKPQAAAILRKLAKSDSRNLQVQLSLAEVSEGADALKQWRSIAARTPAQSSAWFEAKYNVARLLYEDDKRAEAAKMLKYIKAVPPGWEASDLKPKFEKLLKDCAQQ